VLCNYWIERRLAVLGSWSGRSPDAIHAVKSRDAALLGGVSRSPA
jgi:hypothetical protein